MSFYLTVCNDSVKIIGEINIDNTLTTPSNTDLILTTGSTNTTLRILRNTDLTDHYLINKKSIEVVTNQYSVLDPNVDTSLFRDNNNLNVDWATRIAGTSIDEGNEVSVDNNGNVYC